MSTFEIHKNSITNLDTDAIVNAANSGLIEGGGVCGAIFKAAGSAKLAKECAKIGHCNTGDAVITSACDMPNNKFIIHAVGPRYFDGKRGEEALLSGAYKKALELARDNDCKSVGFPLISAGIFGYPLDDAWRVAIKTCKDFIKENPDCDMSIVIVGTNQDIINRGKEILAEM